MQLRSLTDLTDLRKKLLSVQYRSDDTHCAFTECVWRNRWSSSERLVTLLLSKFGGGILLLPIHRQSLPASPPPPKPTPAWCWTTQPTSWGSKTKAENGYLCWVRAKSEYTSTIPATCIAAELNTFGQTCIMAGINGEKYV